MTSSPSGLDRRGVRKFLLAFGLLGVVGVLMLAVSVAAGLIILVAAEVFFAMAYRRFSSKRAKDGQA